MRVLSSGLTFTLALPSLHYDLFLNTLTKAAEDSDGPLGELAQLGSQVAERLGNQASNLKVASSIPGRAK